MKKSNRSQNSLGDMKPLFKNFKFAQAVDQYMNAQRMEMFEKSKETQLTYPTAKLIMLNYHEQYTFPGYYYRIKEIFQDDEAAKERIKKLQELDDQEVKCNNEYGLPDEFVLRVRQELNPQLNEVKEQVIYWQAEAQNAQIDEEDFPAVKQLVEDVFDEKEESMSLQKNPVEKDVFAFDEEDMRLLNDKNNKTSSYRKGSQGDRKSSQGDRKSSQAKSSSSPKTIGKDLLDGKRSRKSSAAIDGELSSKNGGDGLTRVIDNNNNADGNDELSGYESEREVLKRQIEEQVQQENDEVLDEHLNDEQLEKLLEIDSDESIVFNEQDAKYFTNRDTSPFDDLNRSKPSQQIESLQASLKMTGFIFLHKFISAGRVYMKRRNSFRRHSLKSL